jgi:CRP-like cAMP-binding protein
MNPAVAGAAIETLMRIPLFEDLERDEIQLFADAMHERTFAAGETVTAEGDPADGFFLVESGEAAVTVAGEPRGTLVRGDYFGEVALMTGGERTATITATADLACYALSPLDFRTVVEANPTIAWKVFQSTAQTLS